MSKTHSTMALANVLPRLIKEMKGGNRPTKEVIETVWRRVVGDKASENSWPTRLVGGRMTIAVANSGWMYTLNPRKPEILQGIIELLGAGHVKSLSFRIGEGRNA